MLIKHIFYIIACQCILIETISCFGKGCAELKIHTKLDVASIGNKIKMLIYC